MDFRVIMPKAQPLKSSIEYFLFISSTGSKIEDAYTTIPNTNTCLSIYKSNEVVWDLEENICHVTESNRFGISKLYGWHQKPFNVKLTGRMDQICIVFRPLGLANFTQTPLHKLDIKDDPFTTLFGRQFESVKHQLFEANDLYERAEILETFLINQLKTRPTSIVNLCVEQINLSKTIGGFKIYEFCKAHKINESTLYRNFLASTGESVKSFQCKHRFRASLHDLKKKNSYTDLAYSLHYSDQSHFIKSIRKYTGLAPSKLFSRVEAIEKSLLLIT